CGLGEQHDVGAVARGADADGLADTTAGAGDEERFACQICHEGLLLCVAAGSLACGVGPAHDRKVHGRDWLCRPAWPSPEAIRYQMMACGTGDRTGIFLGSVILG